MTRQKVLLIIQSVLCAIIAIMLIVSAISIYNEGIALRATDPMANIYTVEGIAKRVMPILPVFSLAVIVTVIGAVLGIKDENANKPAMNIDIKKNEVTEDAQLEKAKKIRTVVFVLAVICIIVGIFNGSLNDVFVKASRICTECIGLG